MRVSDRILQRAHGPEVKQQPVTRRISEPALDLLFEPALPDGREFADHLRHPALAQVISRARQQCPRHSIPPRPAVAE